MSSPAIVAPSLEQQQAAAAKEASPVVPPPPPPPPAANPRTCRDPQLTDFVHTALRYYSHDMDKMATYVPETVLPPDVGLLLQVRGFLPICYLS
jgi:hypothetical protein